MPEIDKDSEAEAVAPQPAEDENAQDALTEEDLDNVAGGFTSPSGFAIGEAI